MTQLTIKNGTFKVNGEVFNFHFPQEARPLWEKALRTLGVNGDVKVKDWDDTISETEFSDKCKQQPDAVKKDIYLPNLNLEQIKSVLQNDNPAQAVISYVRKPQTEASKLGLKFAEEQAEAEKQEKQHLEECFNDFKTELENSPVEEIEKQKLRTWVKDCDKVLLDNILAYFKDEEGVKASAVSTKRNKVVQLVVDRNDKEIAALMKYSYISATSSLNEISRTKKDYEAAKAEFEEKKEEYADAKQGLKDRQAYIAVMSEMLIVEQDPDACALLKREQLKRDLAKAKKKRESIKRQGLIAFSRGVAVATIEGKADAYIATAAEVGEKIKTATEGVIRTHSSQGIVEESLEQNEAVLDSVSPIARNLVKQYENGTGAAAQSLVLTKTVTNNNGSQVLVGANS